MILLIIMNNIIRNLFNESRFITEFEHNLIMREKDQSNKIIKYINVIHFNVFNNINHNFCLFHYHNYYINYYSYGKIHRCEKNKLVEEIVDKSVYDLNQLITIDYDDFYNNNNNVYTYNTIIKSAHINNRIIIDTWKKNNLIK